MLVWDGHNAPVTAVAFDPVTGAVASGDRNGKVFVRDPVGGSVYERPSPIPGEVTALLFRPNGYLLRAIDRYLLSTPPVVNASRWSSEYTEFDQPLSGVASAGGTLLAVGTGGGPKPRAGKFLLWDEVTGDVRKPDHLEPTGVRAICVLDDGKLVAWANRHRRVTVWDTTKADTIHFNQKHDAASVALAPDGSSVAATMDRAVVVYNIAARRERFTLLGHGGKVTCLAYHPDGQTLLSGSWDETIRVWDAATGTERFTFRWPIRKVMCLAVSTDGLRVAAGGDNGSVVVWDVE